MLPGWFAAIACPCCNITGVWPVPVLVGDVEPGGAWNGYSLFTYSKREGELQGWLKYNTKCAWYSTVWFVEFLIKEICLLALPINKVIECRCLPWCDEIMEKMEMLYFPNVIRKWDNPSEVFKDIFIEFGG